MDKKCSILTLNTEIKNIILQSLLERGYSTKDIAELMEVSMAAASRYIHGTLNPSKESACKALEKLRKEDIETYNYIIAKLAQYLWNYTKKILIEHGDQLGELAEQIADEIASILYQIHNKPQQ